MASKVAALLLLGIICFGLAAADIPRDCCLKTTEKRFPAQLIASYRIQDAASGCEVKATVLITKNGRQLCLVHPEGSTRVQDLLNSVRRLQAQ